MSYTMHQHAMQIAKEHGIYDIDKEAAAMTAGQNAEQMKEFGAPGAFQPATPAPAAPDPRSFTYDAPADSPNTQDQLKRYAGAGVSQNEAYRLLGGPRQRLGA